MKGIINDGFYGFAQQRYQNITGVSKKTPSEELEIEQIYKLLHDLTPIIPKVRCVRSVVPIGRGNSIENVSVSDRSGEGGKIDDHRYEGCNEYRNKRVVAEISDQNVFYYPRTRFQRIQ